MTTTEHQGATAITHSDVVVLDYLAALWAESDDLAPEQRDELMTTVADYIAMRRTALSDPIADPEQIVGRLGPPEALVAAVRRGSVPAHLRRPHRAPPPAPAPAPRGSTPAAEYAAIALLSVVAFVLPGLSTLAGMAVVSGSPRWPVAQKVSAWVLTAGSGAIALLMLLFAVASHNEGAGLLLAYLLAVGGSVVTGLFLLPALAVRK